METAYQGMINDESHSKASLNKFSSFIDGLDHFQPVTEKDKLLPEIRDFLSSVYID